MSAGTREARLSTLDNGLTVCVLPNGQAPIVTCVVWYRLGASADGAGEAGTAHFLEHMMFRGSPRFAGGEVDRLTQALGGANNAFTSHDSTAYHFQFAADHWSKALDIESDRMAELLLLEEDFEHERAVILEEIAMYESEPWDALEQRVRTALFGSHPYGRPILGSRAELQAMDVETLRSFHRRYYCPANAVVVVAGDVGGEVEDRVEQAFAPLAGGCRAAAIHDSSDYPRQQQRIEVERGEVARLMFSLPGPVADDGDHACLRLLLHLLTVGRSSRLHRALVEEEQSCAWISGELGDGLDAGSISLALELVPGKSPARVEARLRELLRQLLAHGVSVEEVERARQLYRADWEFGLERIYQQALSAAAAVAHHDFDFPRRYRAAVLATERNDLLRVASRYLQLDQGVVGWSLPEC